MYKEFQLTARYRIGEANELVASYVHSSATGYTDVDSTFAPALGSYFRKHRDAGLSMLAISIDAGASRKKLAEVTRGLGFPVARLDDTRIARSAIPTALPETRIYGRDGTLRYDSAGRKAVCCSSGSARGCGSDDDPRSEGFGVGCSAGAGNGAEIAAGAESTADLE